MEVVVEFNVSVTTTSPMGMIVTPDKVVGAWVSTLKSRVEGSLRLPRASM